MGACAVVAGTVVFETAPGHAQTDNVPAAQCAALWSGLARYAELSSYLDQDSQREELAQAFRRVALRIEGDPQKVDNFITQQEPLMVRLIDSYIYDQDATSGDIFERLSQNCDALAREHPETRELR